MTGQDIIDDVRVLLSDSEYDESIILTAANGFVNEVFSNNNFRKMESEDDIYISAGDLTATLPDDIKDMLNLLVTSPAALDLMSYYMSYNNFMHNYPNYMTATPNQVRVWTDFADGMRFAAPALTDTVVHIDYIRNPVDMTSPEDDCEIPDPYRLMVAHGTLAFLMEINEDYAEASTERNLNAPRITAFIASEGRGQIKAGPVIMRTRRRRGYDGLYGRLG